jgi:mitogen-activated protein kinase 1/3
VVVCFGVIQVALKRIPDVLSNSENAKRVLREVCILRRLAHPHIIRLKDVFLKPSSTGRAAACNPKASFSCF